MRFTCAIYILLFCLGCKTANQLEPRQVLQREDTLQVNDTPFPWEESWLEQNVPTEDSEACESTQPSIVCTMELRIFELNNQLRLKQGKRALKYQERFAHVAREWSKEQAHDGFNNRGRISHDGFPTKRKDSYISRFGSVNGARIQGENVAYTYIVKQDLLTTADSLFEMWRTSAGHYRNMMGNFESIGIGVYIKDNRYVYATQIFGRHP